MTTALYRRYRPDTFDEVIGQDHVTEPLRAALRANRVTHAYLFSGPRGCGKTTSARILARCLNCAEGPTDTPCGHCDSCRELATGGPGSLDVVEIDAASHGGVDDARDLRERATFAPVRDRYKVFIIDEAHMVTTQGFNALLKLVEEPPEHVKFVFATTEPERVIGTIRSRTHHYPFRLVPPDVLEPYLKKLCDEESITVGEGVLGLVVRAGGGSVRDTLSVLDQLMAGSPDGTLDYHRAVALLGYTDSALLDQTVDALAGGDGAAVYRVVERMVESGHDPRRFVEDLLQRLRDLLIIAVAGDGAVDVLSGTPTDQLERMQVQARNWGPRQLSRAADLTDVALRAMTGATSPRLQLELLLGRILVPPAAAAAPAALAGEPVPGTVGMVGGGAPQEHGGAPVDHRGGGYGPAQAKADYRRRNYGDVEPGQVSGARGGRGRPTSTTAPAAAPGTPNAADTGRERAGRVPEPDRTQPPAGPGGWTEEVAIAGAPRSGEPTAQQDTRTPEQSTTATPHSGAPTAREDARTPVRAATATPHTTPADTTPVGTGPAGSDAAAGTDPAAGAASVPAPVPPASTGPVTPAPSPSRTEGAGRDADMLRQRWTEVVERLAPISRATWALVQNNAQLGGVDGSVAVIVFPTEGLLGAFAHGNRGADVEKAIHEVTGLELSVRAEVAQSAGGPSVTTPNAIAPAAVAPTATSPVVTDPGATAHGDDGSGPGAPGTGTPAAPASSPAGPGAPSSTVTEAVPDEPQGGSRQGPGGARASSPSTWGGPAPESGDAAPSPQRSRYDADPAEDSAPVESPAGSPEATGGHRQTSGGRPEEPRGRGESPQATSPVAASGWGPVAVPGSGAQPGATPAPAPGPALAQVPGTSPEVPAFDDDLDDPSGDSLTESDSGGSGWSETIAAIPGGVNEPAFEDDAFDDAPPDDGTDTAAGAPSSRRWDRPDARGTTDRGVTEASAPPAWTGPAVAASQDDTASVDDADMDSTTSAGLPAVLEILGGTVIEETVDDGKDW